MPNHFLKNKLPKEKGVVLLTGMIFLVVLTIIVVAVMRNSTLEERMASNTRNRQLALQATEAVLRDAETALFATGLATPFDPFVPASFTSACTNGLCSIPVATATPRWADGTLSNTSKTRTFAAPIAPVTTAFTLAGISSQPRYLVELLDYSNGGQAGRICPIVVYRISARGVAQDGSVVSLQSAYKYRPVSCPGL